MFGERRAWPHLLGVPVAHAEALIRRENPRRKNFQLAHSFVRLFLQI